MARPTIRTEEVRAKFLAALSEGMSVANAAGSAGAGRGAMYVWRREDAEFASDWDEAVEVGTDKLEDEARRRAMAGSDAVLMFLLKARRPAQYKDRAVHEHVGSAGGAVQFEQVGNVREELLAKINEVIARREAFEEMDRQRGLQ